MQSSPDIPDATTIVIAIYVISNSIMRVEMDELKRRVLERQVRQLACRVLRYPHGGAT